jgi:hypothetical protein
VKSRIAKQRMKRKQGPLHETLAEVANRRNEKLLADGEATVTETSHITSQA